MKKKLPILLILFVSLFSVNQSAYSYHTLNNAALSSFVFHMIPAFPVDFNVDGGTLGGGNGLTTVQNACSEWDSQPNLSNFCGTLTQGATDITSANFNAIVDPNDGVNDIIFDEDGTILSNIFLLPPGVLGIGLSTTDPAGVITDITIIVNGSIPSSPSADLLATTIHEMGHIWGFAHTPIGGIFTGGAQSGLDPIDPIAIPTMFPFNIPVNDAFGQSLETDDLGSALLLYGP